MASTKPSKPFISHDLYVWLAEVLETEHNDLFKAAQAKADSDSLKFELARLTGKRQVLDLIYTSLTEEDKHGITLWLSRHRAEPSGDRQGAASGRSGESGSRAGTSPSQKPTHWRFNPAQHRTDNPRRKWWQLR